MVGDSKQSIYAFRGCNPKYFIDKNNLYEEEKNGNTAIPLDKNFRSAKNIVDTVNSIFSRIMTDNFGGLNYADNLRQYGGLYDDKVTGYSHLGRAVLDVLQEDVEKPTPIALEGVYSVKKADLVADLEDNVGSTEKLVLKLINEALNKKYYDINTTTFKQITYGDIVILMRYATILSQDYCIFVKN